MSEWTMSSQSSSALFGGRGNYLRILVAYFVVIHVPADGALLPVDNLVRDTRVVRVEFETHVLQGGGE